MSEVNKVFIDAKDGRNEVIWRTGAAPDNFKVRKSIFVTGTIGVPLAHLDKSTVTEVGDGELEHLKKGKSNVVEESYLLIDRDKMDIVFVEFAGRDYESKYTGKLSFDPDFLNFGINNMEVSYTTIKLAEKIKMNRSFFENRSDAMRLVSELLNFEAKVNKEVEAKADERANRRVLLAQTVTTNLPENFKLKIPIFKGEPAQVVDIEIGIDPIDLSCRLISPEVNDFINDTKNSILDEQKTKIAELHPELRIFEV